MRFGNDEKETSRNTAIAEKQVDDSPEPRAIKRGIVASPCLPVSLSPRLAGDESWREQLTSLCEALTEDAAPLRSAIESFIAWADSEFRQSHDHFCLLGEDNFRRYLPVEPLRVRVHPADSMFDVFARAAAARAAGCRSTISMPPELTGPAAEAVARLDALTDMWAGAIEFLEEEDARLAELIVAGRIARVRYAAPARVPAEIRVAAAQALHYVSDAPVLAHGRVELLWYVREQSISHIYHRYGNLGMRSDEHRTEPE
jgi:RHH-type transcriptional regulator, proline utilization regulon repressor / proline dehydrogenase / delta 1-pyrroline-5-carboxylate dehydrogenase